jgi:molecular chaperone HscB
VRTVFWCARRTLQELQMNDFLSKNYFELFNFPLDYQIDLNALRERFREVQKAVHPDRFSADSAQSQRLAMQYAAYANQAFQTLKDPVARGFCLLSLLGRARHDESATIKDPVFLMQQMEFRERLESANREEALEELLAEAESENRALEKKVGEGFRTRELNDKFDEIEIALKKMQFYKRLIEEIEEKM